MMISIALRSIPTLINESQRILKAQASRGVDRLINVNILNNTFSAEITASSCKLIV